MGIDFSLLNTAVAQQGFDLVNRLILLYKMRGKGMSKGVYCDVRNSSFCCCFKEGIADDVFAQPGAFCRAEAVSFAFIYIFALGEGL